MGSLSLIESRHRMLSGLPYKNITDTLPLSFVGKKIKSLVQYGAISQTDTPSPDNPRDIVCNNGAIKWGVTGKNLLDMAEENIYLRYYINDSGAVTSNNQNFYNTKFISVKPNTTYTLSVSEPIYYSSIMEYDSNKVFLQRTLDGSASEKHSSMTITTRADTAYILIGSNPNRVTMYMEDVTSIDWMLNEGSTALPYEPYTEGIITDGTPEVLSVGGANLLDPSTVSNENIFINRTTGGTTVPSTTGGVFRHSDFIKIVGGEEYFFGITPYSASMAGIAWYSEADSSNYISGVNGTTLKNNHMIETAPEDANYIRFCWRIDDGYDTDWENTVFLCKNGDMVRWQPYISQTASVQNLFATTDYADTQDIISGVVTRKVGVKVLTGSEGIDWYVNTSGVVNIPASDIGMDDAIYPSALSNIISTHFIGSSWTPARSIDNGIFITSTGSFGFSRTAIGNTSAAVNEWLAAQYAAGTPVIVLYPLAEETTETVSPQTLQCSGTTVVDSNAKFQDITLDIKYMAGRK